MARSFTSKDAKSRLQFKYPFFVDTLMAHIESCVGITANMIKVKFDLTRARIGDTINIR